MGQTILLSDDQMHRFIADGFLVLEPPLDPASNARITDELAFSLSHERPPAGDNVLARIPALNEMLESPIVRGAMTSLLGPDYAWSPHRAIHNSEPIDQDFEDFDPFEHAPKMGKGSASGSGWHQDGHSIAGRSRYHTVRQINMFYFPHEIPLEMGPTRILGGSHLYANLYDIKRQQLVMQHIPAGTVAIAHFDIGHAGTPNHTDISRYMLKFVALRQQNPTAPSWDHKDPQWRTPDNLFNPDDTAVAWTSIWNWMKGVPRSTDIDVAQKDADVPALMKALKTDQQGDRLKAIYDLAAVGAAAVDSLVEALLATAGSDRHLSPEPGDPAFSGYPKDHLKRQFSNRQFVPEDAAIALGAIGRPAVNSLLNMLEHTDPWIRMNAAYALGDVGRELSSSEADRVGALLDDPEPSVIRVVGDAICSLSNFGQETVKRLHRLFTEERAGFDDVVMGNLWTNRNQICFVASWALLARVSAGDPPAAVEEALIDALKEPQGYTPGVAVMGLQRLGTVSGLQAAVRYLAAHRWDHFRHEMYRSHIEQTVKAAE